MQENIALPAPQRSGILNKKSASTYEKGFPPGEKNFLLRPKTDFGADIRFRDTVRACHPHGHSLLI